MTDLEFEQIVAEAAQQRSPLVLPNSSSDRAAVVLKNIFQQSEYSIYILANKLESDICKDDKYTQSLKEAINRNVQVSVLCAEPPNTDSPAYKVIEEAIKEKKNNVEVRIITTQARLNFADLNSGKDFLFAVADKSMYRFENDITNHKAFFSFNDTTRSIQLTKMFLLAFGVSDRYQISH